MSTPVRITLFNHKGGVGKTTLTANIAFALAEMGKSVLLVDSDPQCSLTSYLLPDDTVDDLLEESSEHNGQTIWTERAPSMYTTVHYDVQASQTPPIICELQVRSLADEVWGEVSHRVNYPHRVAERGVSRSAQGAGPVDVRLRAFGGLDLQDPR